MGKFPVGKEVLISIIEDVEWQIRNDGLSKAEKGQLFHELGSLYGLIGDFPQQQFAWLQAAALCPGDEIFQQSLESIKS